MMEALKDKIAVAEGWIEHEGGKCPVPPDKLVEVQFKNGNHTRFPAEARSFMWAHSGEWHDIVKYRVVDNRG
jgi:hypothetical protein